MARDIINVPMTVIPVLFCRHCSMNCLHFAGRQTVDQSFNLKRRAKVQAAQLTPPDPKPISRIFVYCEFHEQLSPAPTIPPLYS